MAVGPHLLPCLTTGFPVTCHGDHQASWPSLELPDTPLPQPHVAMGVPG